MPKLVKLVRPPSTLAEELFCRSPLGLLQRRPPCTCVFSCLVLRLPPWQDVADELLAQSLLDAGFCFFLGVFEP